MNSRIVLFRFLDELNNEKNWKPLTSENSKSNFFFIDVETLRHEGCSYGTKLVVVKEHKSDKTASITKLMFCFARYHIDGYYVYEITNGLKGNSCSYITENVLNPALIDIILSLDKPLSFPLKPISQCNPVIFNALNNILELDLEDNSSPKSESEDYSNEDENEDLADFDDNYDESTISRAKETQSNQFINNTDSSSSIESKETTMALLTEALKLHVQKTMATYGSSKSKNKSNEANTKVTASDDKSGEISSWNFTIIQAITKFFTHCFIYHGRCSRQEYFIDSLCIAVISCVGVFLYNLVNLSESFPESDFVDFIHFGISIAVTIASVGFISLSVRRAHDCGYSGYLLLLMIVPMFMLPLQLCLLCIPGNKGKNIYGDPSAPFN